MPPRRRSGEVVPAWPSEPLASWRQNRGEMLVQIEDTSEDSLVSERRGAGVQRLLRSAVARPDLVVLVLLPRRLMEPQRDHKGPTEATDDGNLASASLLWPPSLLYHACNRAPASSRTLLF